VAEDADKQNGPTEDLPPRPDPPGYFEGESMTRRRVFTLAGAALGGLAGAAATLPEIGFSLHPLFDRPEEEFEAIGRAEDFTPDAYKQAIITVRAGIGEAGKTSIYVRRGSADLGEDPDEFVAISTRCAHLGCPVRFVKAAGNFICPCHGGIYDFEGKVLGGPPVRPLDRFQTRVRGGQLEIGPRYSVTSQLEPVRARDPGEFTGGIWEYIYPPRPTTAAPPD
jgi:Rieske Fe-S protein